MFGSENANAGFQSCTVQRFGLLQSAQRPQGEPDVVTAGECRGVVVAQHAGAGIQRGSVLSLRLVQPPQCQQHECEIVADGHRTQMLRP